MCYRLYSFNFTFHFYVSFCVRRILRLKFSRCGRIDCSDRLSGEQQLVEKTVTEYLLINIFCHCPGR